MYTSLKLFVFINLCLYISLLLRSDPLESIYNTVSSMERTSIMLGAYIDPSIHIYTISYTFLSLSCFYSMRDPGLKFNSVAHQLCMYILRSFQYGGQGGLLGLDGPMGEKEEGKKGREVEGLKKSIHMYICCCYFLLYIHGEIKFEKARKKKKKKKE